MQVHIDFERRQAIAELLAQPDPPELRRGHRLRVEGKADRFAMVQTIAAAYVQARLLALQERRAAGVVEIEPRANIVWTLRLVGRREVAAA